MPEWIVILLIIAAAAPVSWVIGMACDYHTSADWEARRERYLFRTLIFIVKAAVFVLMLMVVTRLLASFGATPP